MTYPTAIRESKYILVGCHRTQSWQFSGERRMEVFLHNSELVKELQTSDSKSKFER